MKIFRIVLIASQALGIIGVIRDVYIYKTTGIISSNTIYYYFFLGILAYVSCILQVLLYNVKNKIIELKNTLIEKQKVYIKMLEKLIFNS